MSTNYLKQKSVFDTSELLPGRAVQLIESGFEHVRKQTGIIKDISPFSITLLIVSLGDYKDDKSFSGEVEEKTFPVGAFEGIGCYTLKRMFAEEALTEQTTTTK